jgi:hypothetical protein
MAVPIQFFSVIVPKSVIQQKYQGGLQQYKDDCPNQSYTDDAHLTRVGFMDADSLSKFCESLISAGLHWDKKTETSKDFTVVQNLQGANWKTDWLKITSNGESAYYV